MFNHKVLVLACLPVAVLSLASRRAEATNQESASRPLVAKLASFLAAQRLDSFAAEDPTRPGQVVAVLHIPNSQLLLISGRCEPPAAIRARLAAKAYRDAYSDLHGCAAADSRLFIQDLGADGLAIERPGEGAAFDIVYERMTQQTRFDGDFKSQKISGDEYRKRYAALDAEYARLASVLLNLGAQAQ